MTVYSINKSVFEQANMTAAAAGKPATSAEAAFAAALQTASAAFGRGAEVSAGSALKDSFERPVQEPRDARPTDRPERAERKSDRAAETRPARRDDHRAAAKPADEPERPAEPRQDDQARVEDAPAAGKPAEDATKADAGQGESQTADTAATTDAAAQDAGQAAASQPQQQAAQAVAAPTTQILAEDGDGETVEDPNAGQARNAGAQTADAGDQADAGLMPTDAAGTDADQAEPEAKTAATGTAKTQAAATQGQTQVQGQVKAEATGGEQVSEAARRQADDLAETLAGTGANVKVKVTVDTAATTQAQVDPAAEAAAAVEDVLAADPAAEFTNAQTGTGQSGQQGGANQGAATAAAQQVARNALDNAQAAQGKAADARPFAAALAAQVEGTGSAQAGQSAGNQTQTVAGLNAASGAQGTQKSAAAQAAQQPHQPRHVEPKQVIDQIGVQIAKQAKDGTDTIKVQLKPVDLGRIEIKLEVQDGRVQAHVTADSKETLSLLQRDARGLEKALQDAGLKTEGQMTFSLANDGQQAQGGNEANRQGARRRSRLAAAAANDSGNTAAAEAPRAGRRSGVDIKV